MANYVIEIGLDGNGAPRYDGTYSHIISLVKMNESDGKVEPWWFTHFRSGDQIAFRVCDYTSSAFGEPVIALNSFIAYFLDSRDRRCLSPCLSEGVISSGQNCFPILDDKSLLSNDRVHCWRFAKSPDSTEDKYWPLIGPNRALLKVNIATTVMAGSAKELRWFTHDPEIIVGEGGFKKPYRQRPSSPKRR